MFLLGNTLLHAQQVFNSKYVSVNGSRLAYHPDEQGNIIPDFSKVGYLKGRAIPDIRIVSVVHPDDALTGQEVIQRAIDEVAQLSMDKNGFRGAILLKAGVYKVPDAIRINHSGIVLRGEGVHEGGTVIIATGNQQRDLVQVSGEGNRKEIQGSRVKITNAIVPTGAFSFDVESAQGFKKGDHIVIHRPGTAEWIRDLKMDQIVERPGTRQWKPSEYDLHFERTITAVKGNTICLDIPVVMAMEEKYGGGYVYKYEFEGRISGIGVENILFQSEFTSETDENHGWSAVSFDKMENGWIRNVVSKYFGYGCVNLRKGSKFVTVDQSKCLDLVSVITGGRRYSFNNDGQVNLVMNCEAVGGRHDYVTGGRVCGPNVFYNCKASNTHSDIGPHHRWGVGTLYDNIVTDGEINVQDRGNWGSGHGWAGATQIIWNCTAKAACVQNPYVSARNYCIGLKGNQVKGRFPDRPDGEWEGLNAGGIQPFSLYMAQVKKKGRD